MVRHLFDVDVDVRRDVRRLQLSRDDANAVHIIEEKRVHHRTVVARRARACRVV